MKGVMICCLILLSTSVGAYQDPPPVSREAMLQAEVRLLRDTNERLTKENQQLSAALIELRRDLDALRASIPARPLGQVPGAIPLEDILARLPAHMRPIAGTKETGLAKDDRGRWIMETAGQNDVEILCRLTSADQQSGRVMVKAGRAYNPHAKADFEATITAECPPDAARAITQTKAGEWIRIVGRLTEIKSDMVKRPDNDRVLNMAIKMKGARIEPK